MRVALVHDYLTQYGGAERVLEAFCEIWPEAPIFTLLYDEQKTGGAFIGRKIRTSFLQKLPLVKKHHRSFLMLMPLAVEQFDLSKYDLVLSDSASFAKGVITGPRTRHVCYCHTPTRYAWDDSHKYIEEFGYPSLVKKIAPFFINYLRVWDEAAAERVDHFIANSNFVASRVKKYYNRQAEVIYPPVKTKYFESNGAGGDYFFIISRFLSYKKIDLAVKAFNQLGWPLKIAGDGPEKKRLQKIARENIEFLGLVDDERLKQLYAGCRAFVFAQEEDFGITLVEAMSAGRPVIAYRAGGALEIVKEGESGIFFDEQTETSLLAALKEFDNLVFSADRVRAAAAKFDKEVFKQKIKDYINNLKK
ncbi:MAG: Glycosyl transferase group 1 [Parcubacteria group bacterium GW2011_GWA2_42_11]|nr:MAG: Glycosyl transferase group 1 [Parcubacteria group bacterium GW2011_GWA2_42_11]KKT76536.1 MAG: Glycosyl transferase group 1 [Parcubacteria group bacterium GW2011_GWF2_44_7]